MPAPISFPAWASLVNGQAVGSGECVALVNDYCARVLGAAPPATTGGAHDPYASSMWEGLPAGAGYRKISPALPMMPGDIPVWKFGSAVAPLSHTAVGVQDLGLAVMVWTQNTNGHRYAEKTTLPKAGLYGYLRPVTGAGISPASWLDDWANPLGRGTAEWFAQHPGAVRDPLGAAADTVAPGASAALATWGKITESLSSPAFWQRVGIGLLGIILIMLVLVKILSPSGAVTTVSGLIKKAPR